jgi:5-formyltetrahydrofolate cyclo-ligase
MQEKKDLRKTMLEMRAALNPVEKQRHDQFICERLAQMILEKNAKVVHSFLPMGDEIDIFPLIETLLEKGITVVTPKALKQRKMMNLVLRSLGELEDGIFGTKHPANTHEHTGSYDFFIVPGLAFDRNNYRLGYGSGYYDAFLATQPTAFKLGICYPFQLLGKVPREPHDVPLDGLLYPV